MTYREYCEGLKNNYIEASQQFLEKNKTLSRTRKPEDLYDDAAYKEARQHWRLASNNYWEFLLMIRHSKVNPEDEIRLS